MIFLKRVNSLDFSRERGIKIKHTEFPVHNDSIDEKKIIDQADQFFVEGAYSKARSLYQKVEHRIEAVFGLAMVDIHSNQFDEAFKWLSKFSTDPVCCLLKGYVQYLREDSQGAMSIWAEILFIPERELQTDFMGIVSVEDWLHTEIFNSVKFSMEQMKSLFKQGLKPYDQTRQTILMDLYRYYFISLEKETRSSLPSIIEHLVLLDRPQAFRLAYVGVEIAELRFHAVDVLVMLEINLLKGFILLRRGVESDHPSLVAKGNSLLEKGLQSSELSVQKMINVFELILSRPCFGDYAQPGVFALIDAIIERHSNMPRFYWIKANLLSWKRKALIQQGKVAEANQVLDLMSDLLNQGDQCFENLTSDQKRENQSFYDESRSLLSLIASEMLQ